MVAPPAPQVQDSPAGGDEDDLAEAARETLKGLFKDLLDRIRGRTPSDDEAPAGGGGGLPPPPSVGPFGGWDDGPFGGLKIRFPIGGRGWEGGGRLGGGLRGWRGFGDPLGFGDPYGTGAIGFSGPVLGGKLGFEVGVELGPGGKVSGTGSITFERTF